MFQIIFEFTFGFTPYLEHVNRGVKTFYLHWIQNELMEDVAVRPGFRAAFVFSVDI